MNVVWIGFLMTVVGTSAYAVGRLHGGWSYKHGWRAGWRGGWEEGDRHARKRILAASREHDWTMDPSDAPTKDLARAWSRVVNPGRHHRRFAERRT